MNGNDLSPDAYFTTNNKDIWKLKEYCMSPTCRLVNLEDDTEESFGMDGLTAGRFHKVEMPKIDSGCFTPTTITGSSLRSRLGC